VERPETKHPHLRAIGLTLERSLQRHVVENPAVRSAFDELFFELRLARQMGTPVGTTGLVEHTV